nr:unnamed protein product [Callosobruchus chinensis]
MGGRFRYRVSPTGVSSDIFNFHCLYRRCHREIRELVDFLCCFFWSEHTSPQIVTFQVFISTEPIENSRTYGMHKRKQPCC